jgi:hypothetical protein
VVADTSALVSLGVPRADAEYGTEEDPDPLQYLLTSCDVLVPSKVVAELRDITQYQDIHGAAANNVLTASEFYTVKDPYEESDTGSRPAFGLDDGETDGIVLANAVGADGFLTDEFGGTNFAVIHATLRGSLTVPTPRLILDYARNGHMTHGEARKLITTISTHRSWGNSPYVSQILGLLD